MKKYQTLIVVVAVFSLCASTVLAGKLFAVDAYYNVDSSPDRMVRVEDSSFPKLIKNWINGDGGFSALSGKDVFSADIQFFGVPQALILSAQQRSDGIYEVQMTSALTGMNVTLEGVDREDLREQIIDWIMLDGGDDALDLLEAVALASTASVSDGAPGATTAQMADSSFGLFGFYPRTSTDRNMRGFESGAFLSLNVIANSFNTSTPVGDMQGDRLDFQVPLWLHFNSWISYVGQINLNRTTIEGTDFFGFGADMGLAFRPIVRTDDEIFGWQIAPFFGGKSVGSADGVTAAILYDYGINNRFEWRLMKRGLISWTCQLSKYDNLHISVDEYNLNSKVNQTIIKNGVLLELPVFSLNSLNANFFLTDTRFLQEANTSNYQSLGLGVGYNNDTFSLQANLGFDITGDYQGTQLNLGCSWDL